MVKIKKEEDLFKKNNIQYPIFQQCIKYTKDDFWKTIFEDLSFGKCPKSMYISNDTIYSSNKKKNFSYTIPSPEERNAKDVVDEVREILIANTTICSVLDIQNKKETAKNNSDEDITNTTQWSDIRKKNLREVFIIKFVARMSKKYKLSVMKTRHLYSLIQLAFLYKTQTSKDIKFVNKRIESIQGIVFDETKGHFVNLNHDSRDQEIEEEEDNDSFLYYYWDRYVSSKCKSI